MLWLLSRKVRKMRGASPRGPLSQQPLFGLIHYPMFFQSNLLKALRVFVPLRL